LKLEDLAILYGSDKYYSHSYIPFYEELFAGRPVKRLLEIGIGFKDLMIPFTPKFVPGSSLRMWADYFPEAEIYACDIREETLISEGRIHSMVCDQSSGVSLATMAFEFSEGLTKGFDVIIDDGSHHPEHQIFTAQCLLSRLNKGGVFVIEDVREPRIASIIGGTVYQFDKRPDDCLVVIQR
jgi:hypothetical protein